MWLVTWQRLSTNWLGKHFDDSANSTQMTSLPLMLPYKTEMTILPFHVHSIVIYSFLPTTIATATNTQPNSETRQIFLFLAWMNLQTITFWTQDHSAYIHLQKNLGWWSITTSERIHLKHTDETTSYSYHKTYQLARDYGLSSLGFWSFVVWKNGIYIQDGEWITNEFIYINMGSFFCCCRKPFI